MVKLLPLSFPRSFTKNNRQDLKMGYADASRRQLQSAIKTYVFIYNFVTKYDDFSSQPKGSELLLYVFAPVCMAVNACIL